MATVGVAALLGMVGMGATALVTATPASAAAVNQEFAFRIPLFGGSLGYTGVVISSNWSDSAATVKQGSNFTFLSQPSTAVVPTTSSGFTLVDIHDTFNYYPIPAGTTFVSAAANGPVSFTPKGGGTATTSPLTVKYCPTTTTPGCTADPTNPNFPNTFLGNTPAPYLMAGTQAGLKFTAGGSLTTPGLTVTLKADTGGTTVNWTQTEFKTTSDLTLGPVTVLGYPSNAPIPPVSSPSMALLNPPPTLASVSVAGTASVNAVLPNSGPLAGGTQVKVIGQFLDNPTSVTFGGTPATNVIPLTSDSLLATAPAGSGTVDVQVTTALSGSPANPLDKFTYTAGPIVTGVSPSVGPPAGGTSVKITGLQLTGATAVHFGTTAATITANTATSITATAPPGTGVVDVTVTAGGKTSTISQQDRFSYLAGYFLAASDGGVFAYGSAPFNGSAGGSPLNKPVVGIASTPDGAGYWLVASDGGVFAYGNAQFFGSTGAQTLNSPVVGMDSTPDGFGYWLVAADGGVFAFGDAQFFGSMGGTHINKPVVGIATNPNGGGYWLAAADGGIFAFGDAPFAGSQGANPLNAPVVGVSATSTGKGYWMTAGDGGVFSEGDAAFAGSAGGAPLNKPVVGIVGSGTSAYLLTASDGGVFNYGGTYYGSAGGTMLNKPMVGIAAT
jgi:hypothetical protein